MSFSHHARRFLRLDVHVYAAVRERRPKDLQACAGLLAQVHAKHRYPVHWPDDPCGWLTPPGMAQAWIAASDDEVIGHVCLIRQGDPTESLRVERLFVATSQRGNGVGRSLVTAAGAWAAQHEYRLSLEVLDNCTAAIRLYRQLGWRLTHQTTIDWAGDVAHHLLHFESP